MNVIFLDFDGVLDTIHHSSHEDIEKKVKILSNICKEYKCKVVIEASAKDAIDEETMQIYSDWVKYIFNLFKRYDIDCIGRTPTVKRKLSTNSYLPIWKEDEIRLYLYRHPEIEHYCVIDDDDTINMLKWERSDLDKVRRHLVTTKYYSDNPEEEGLLECHKKEVGKMLKKDNEIKRLILKRDRIKR